MATQTIRVNLTKLSGTFTADVYLDNSDTVFIAGRAMTQARQPGFWTFTVSRSSGLYSIIVNDVFGARIGSWYVRTTDTAATFAAGDTRAEAYVPFSQRVTDPLELKGISLLDVTTPQLSTGVSWHIGHNGEVVPAIFAGEFNMDNGQGKHGYRYPPSDTTKIRSLCDVKATFGNMLTSLSWLEEVIQVPGWRKHHLEICVVGAVAGWLLLAKRVTQNHLAALRRARLRLSGSVWLDDATAGSSFCELAVSETKVRLEGVMQMFKPSADILRSPKVTQMAFYSEALRGIEGKIDWRYPEIQCERLYSLVEMELDETKEIAASDAQPRTLIVNGSNDYDFRTLLEAVNKCAENASLENEQSRFEQFSVFLENFLHDVGVVKVSGDGSTRYPPTGELLFMASVMCLLIEQSVSAHEDDIMTALEDTATHFAFEGKGESIFPTAHRAAIEMVREVFESHVLMKPWFMPLLDGGRLNWSDLSVPEQGRFAEVERSLTHMNKLPHTELAIRVRQERLKFWKAKASELPNSVNGGDDDDRLVTVDDVAKLLVEVSKKTLLNSDVKTWGPCHSKVNRCRVWRWGDIKSTVLATRQLKQV